MKNTKTEQLLRALKKSGYKTKQDLYKAHSYELSIYPNDTEPFSKWFRIQCKSVYGFDSTIAKKVIDLL